ncbi:MAG: hypothetical protein O9322_05160 [Beijerinckiaceae bacterium]|nr:hypothetical protein [Beijerinckiaceae bacterium]MCZ8298911.1 hypothetical protein [Beijerinckiaceae bacterium]
MRTSHHVDGPGSFVLSGPDARPTFVANDNLAPAAPAPGEAIGLVLALLHGPGNEPHAALQMLDRHGDRTNSLLLAHDDPDLIALWRGLGRDLGLPLYLFDEEHGLNQVTRRPGDVSYPRRAGSPLSGRRTRTAQKRQMPLSRLPESGGAGSRQTDGKR